MPHAIATLVKLTDAEKPEVARRSATTLLNMAGIPTDTKSQPPPSPSTSRKKSPTKNSPPRNATGIEGNGPAVKPDA